MHQDWEKNLKTQIFWIFDKEKRGFFTTKVDQTVTTKKGRSHYIAFTDKMIVCTSDPNIPPGNSCFKCKNLVCAGEEE